MATTQYFSDATRIMITDVRARYPHLSKEEEDAFVHAWRDNGDTKARDRLVLGHMDLMLKLVNKLRGYGIPCDELLSLAVQGMQRAIPGYETGRGLRFGTFALPWVKESMMTYIMANVRPVSGPHTTAAKAMFFHLGRLRRELDINGPLTEADAIRVKTRLMETLPSAEKLSIRSIMDSATYMESTFASADAPIGGRDGDEGRMLMDMFVDEADSAEQILGERTEEKLQSSILKKALDALTGRQQDIFYHRRLIENPLTLEELAGKYRVSRERIRQIECRAMEIVEAQSRLLMREHERAFRDRALATRQDNTPTSVPRVRLQAIKGISNPFVSPPVAKPRAKPYTKMRLSSEEIHRRRSQTTMRGNMSRTPEERSMITLKGNMSRTPEQRRLISLKSAETLRRKRAEQSALLHAGQSDNAMAA